MNCLSWIYILKKQTKRYSESHKELAPLVSFPAMRERNAQPARRLKKHERLVHIYYIICLQKFALFEKMEYTLVRKILILYRQNMTKKLSIIALMGLGVVLAGCSVPGTQDPQIVAQTQMIQQMQTQITLLLSGVDTLKAENAQLSGMLAKVTAYVDTQTQTQVITSHGSAPLLDSGSIETGLVDTGIVENLSGTQDDTGAMTWVVEVNTGGTIDTGIVATISGSKDNSGTKSVLDELKKASESKKVKAKTGTIIKIPTPSAIK